MHCLTSPLPSLILRRAAALLRAGVPGIGVSLPVWPEDSVDEDGNTTRGAAPDEHLLPEGTVIYCGDEAAETDSETPGPRVYILQNGQPKFAEDVDDSIWEVPLRIIIEMDRRAEGLEAAIHEVAAVLTGDFTAAGGGTAEARWTTEALRVDYVFADSPVVLTGASGEGEAGFEFSIRCRFPV